MLRLKTASREAAYVFLLSRLVIVLLTTFTIFVLPLFFPTVGKNIILDLPYKNDPYNLTAYFFSWLHWDVKAYVNIAYYGYHHTPDVAFFPLWPLMQHYAGFLLGGRFPGSYYLAGLLLANICFYGALVLLYCLLAEDFESVVARRTLYYFAFAPYALFFFVGYTESLFVLLCLAIFLLLRRGQPLDWWLAGLLGCLATLSRSSGVLLTIPFIIMYMQRFWLTAGHCQHNWLQKLNALMPIVLIPIGVIVYMLYLNNVKGNPFIFKIEEDLVWHRRFMFPWDSFGKMIGVLFSQSPIIFNVGNIVYSIFTLMPFVVLAVGWKRIPLHYGLFALALAMFALCFPVDIVVPFLSQPRYMMIIFPVAVILAVWGKHPRFHQCFIVLSSILFGINVILFAANYWVA